MARVEQKPAARSESRAFWRSPPVDGVALALVLPIAVENGKRWPVEVVGIGLGVYALGPPVIHLMHDAPGMALIDLAVRLGAPFGLSLLGASLAVGPGGSLSAGVRGSF